MSEIHKHIIYIPHNGEENLLSQQLAYAFAKHHSHSTLSNQATMIIQHQSNKKNSDSNIRPLEIINPNDTLQILFTPVQNLNAPLHDQIKIDDLLKLIPSLVDNLSKDGLKPNDCTIQLYTLQHSDQDSELIDQLARQLINKTKSNNIIIEWHVIPKLNSLSAEQINQIFQPSITCHAVFHAIVDNKDKSIKIIESCGIYSDNNTTSPSNKIH